LGEEREKKKEERRKRKENYSFAFGFRRMVSASLQRALFEDMVRRKCSPKWLAEFGLIIPFLGNDNQEAKCTFI
jgi:hypothetical protein